MRKSAKAGGGTVTAAATMRLSASITGITDITSTASEGTSMTGVESAAMTPVRLTDLSRQRPVWIARRWRACARNAWHASGANSSAAFSNGLEVDQRMHLLATMPLYAPNFLH